MLALAAVSFAARVLTSMDITWHRGDTWVIVANAVWASIYFAAFLGRQRQDRRHGAVRRAGRARRRHRRERASCGRADAGASAELPIPGTGSFPGLGFVGILLGNRRRALHDVIAGTTVIYSWDARAARLRFLSRG